MSHWWLKWAERIAVVLAELWIRSKSGSTGPAGDDANTRAEPQEPSTNPNPTDAPSRADEQQKP